MNAFIQRENHSESSTADQPFLRLNPDKSRPLALLVFSLVMIYCGGKMVAGGVPEGWFLLTIFSVSLLSCLASVLPGSCFLQIDRDGVIWSSSFRRKQYRWDQIERMGIFQLGIIRRIGIDLNANYSGPERTLPYDKPPSGFHISLPAMRGMEIEDQLDFMERCQQACLQQSVASLT